MGWKVRLRMNGSPERWEDDCPGIVVISSCHTALQPVVAEPNILSDGPLPEATANCRFSRRSYFLKIKDLRSSPRDEVRKEALYFFTPFEALGG